MYRPVASDLDGTWTSHPEIRGEVDFIVTGNNWDKYDEIMDEENLDIPIFFNPEGESLADIVKHKAHIINKTGVRKFYEDQSVQVNMLKLLCPDCTVVLVSEGRTAL